MGIKAADRVAPPSAPLSEWNSWLCSMSSRLIYTPWPFSVSVTDEGLTCNVRVGLDLPKKKGARRRPVSDPGQP